MSSLFWFQFPISSLPVGLFSSFADAAVHGLVVNIAVAIPK